MKKILAFIFWSGLALHAATVVAPNGFENKEGDSSGIPLFGGDSVRTQVIYGNQHFSLFPPEGGYITELRFRADGAYSNPFSGTADVEIRLSTTQAGADGLNPLMNANVGADETVVLPRRVISLSSGPVVPGGPNSFSVVIPLPNRFTYMPANGNLLMDAFVRGASGLNNLDWDSSGNDGVSVAASSLTANFGVVSGTSLITEFVFEPIPEPSPVLLTSLVGLICLFFWRRRNVIA